MKSAIVVDPALDDGSEHMRQVLDGFVALQLQSPAAHRLPDRSSSITADGRREVHKDATISIDGLPRPKRVAKKVKPDMLIVLLSMNILAIDHPGFLGMKFQATLLQASLKPMPEIQRLFQSPAMDQPIISVPAKWKLGKMSRHPAVKRIVKEEVCQEWGNHPTLRRTSIPRS
jgi:hypothetical protein